MRRALAGPVALAADVPEERPEFDQDVDVNILDIYIQSIHLAAPNPTVAISSKPPSSLMTHATGTATPTCCAGQRHAVGAAGPCQRN